MRTQRSDGKGNLPLKQWLAYSSSVAAFLAVAPRSEAQVVYTDVDPDVALDGTSYDIDLDGDGIVDVQFAQTGSTYSSGIVFDAGLAFVPDGNAVLGTPGTSSNTNLGYPSVLASGQPIGPSNSNFFGASLQLLGVGVGGMLPPGYGVWVGQSGFIGVRFDIGGETHYGWVELQVSAIAETVTVKGYAYETMPDVAIVAGDQGMTTGLSQLTKPVQLGVFPNPARDLATVDFSGLKAGTAQLSVINGIGRVIQTQQVSVTEGSNRMDLHLGSLPAGSYFVRLSNADQVAFQKVTRVE